MCHPKEMSPTCFPVATPMPKGASACECKATRCHFPVFELTLLMFENIFGLFSYLELKKERTLLWSRVKF